MKLHRTETNKETSKFFSISGNRKILIKYEVANALEMYS